jgi:acyl transferase domain-containing protein
MGGTNVHVLVAEAPGVSTDPAPGPVVLPLSARDGAALSEAAARLRDHLAARRPALADVAHTLTTGRRAFRCRAAVVADTVDTAIAALDALGLGQVTGGDGPLREIARRWVDGAGDLPETGGRRIPLPTYPFQRRRFWIEPARRGGQA